METDTDPFSEVGSIWSFNYFFINRRSKRIAYFYCFSASLASSPSAVKFNLLVNTRPSKKTVDGSTDSDDEDSSNDDFEATDPSRFILSSQDPDPDGEGENDHQGSDVIHGYNQRKRAMSLHDDDDDLDDVSDSRDESRSSRQ